MKKNLKKRILGAIITVVVLVILLPTVLSTKAPKVDEFKIPNPPSIPKWVDQSTVKTVKIDLNYAKSKTFKENIVSKNITKDAPPFNHIPSNKAGLDLQGRAIAWVVKVGAFNDHENASKYLNILRGEGFKSYVVKDKSGMKRVYVGPILKRKEAARQKKKLATVLKIKNLIIQRYHP
jgi:cell division septation protein DedD